MKARLLCFVLVFVGALLLAGCTSQATVGELRTESQAVELGDASSVRVEVELGAGNLDLTSGAEKLLEADFTYNVAQLKPEVTYTDGTLVVRQPEVGGLPSLQNITNYRNEWDLRLSDAAPMDLRVDVGAGASDLKLAGLSLTRLNITLGAGESTIDLSGDWARDLDITIDAGVGEVSVWLPNDVGTRVEVDSGIGSIEAVGLTQDGDVYTNAAYGVSAVTLQVKLEAGIGQIRLQVEEAAATPDYSAVTEALSQQIRAAVEAAGITGLSVALVDDQELVWAEGFGYADRENGIAATPQTVYMVASISKLFTAAAILQLADQGKIDIDQPLQTYLPAFSIQSRFPDAGPITPRSLLYHHAGLPSDWTNGMFAFGDDLDALTRSEFHNLLAEVQQAHATNPPNTAFSYSNLSYSLLGHTVEQVTGQDFIAYMDEALLGPLGMDTSSFMLKPNMQPQLSKEYRDGAAQTAIWSRDIPAAALRSTVVDLSRFMMLVFDEGELDGQTILQAETVAEMLSPQNSDVPLDVDARWGLGWWLLPLPGLEYAGQNAWHAGGAGMWNSLLVILPEHKLGLVLLNNSGANAGNLNFHIATTILEQALKVKAGLERPATEPPAVVSLNADELRSYQGLYTTNLGWLNIRADGMDLYADALGQSFKLLPHGEGRFSLEGVSPSDARMVIKAVNGRTVVYLYGLVVDVSYGERIEPPPISQAWLDRVGSYEITNAKPGFVNFLTNVQLKHENGFLLLGVTRAESGEPIEFPIGPLSDDEAVILGLGRNHGETISVVEVEGEEQIFYSGYLMKKTGAAESLQQALAAAVESPETVFPGALVYVHSPELGAWSSAAGLADIETNTPMRADDQFRAGSLMKPFISVVILQLVEEGLFSLDDPLTTVLPVRVTDKFAGSDQITVRMLLNHTSGIPEWSTAAADAEVAANPAKVWEVEEFLDLAAAQEPAFAPGEEHAYANTNYNLLGLVIEEATGRSWREEVRQRILQPLGLENTSLPEPGETAITGDHARGYEPLDGQLVDFTAADPSMAGAAGGGALVTTAADLARFLAAVLAGELFQETGTLDELLTFVDAPDEAGVPYWYGLGMEKYVLPGNVEMIGHLGCTAGYCSAVHYLPAQEITVAAMINIKDPGSLYFQLFLPTLELLVPEFSLAQPPASR